MDLTEQQKRKWRRLKEAFEFTQIASERVQHELDNLKKKFNDFKEELEKDAEDTTAKRLGLR